MGGWKRKAEREKEKAESLKVKAESQKRRVNYYPLTMN